jgi:hypothetical protein
MSSRQCGRARLSATILIALSIPPLAAISQTTHKITVARNVHISAQFPGDDHAEVLMAADGRDPRRLIACVERIVARPPFDSSMATVAYVSHDAGATWKETLAVVTGQDPTCTFGPDGTAYLVSLAEPGMRIFRSRDGGLTWNQTSTTRGIDREYVIVDTTSSKYRGQMYITGTGVGYGLDSGYMAGLALFRSRDSGANFDGPVMRISPPPKWTVGMGNNVVMSDGTIAALFGELFEMRAGDPVEGKVNARILVVTSTDGGQRLNPAVKVDDWWMRRGVSGAHIPYLAVDPGSPAFKDRLYAVWADGRSGHVDIMLSYSTDKGKTWSPAQVINDDPIRPKSDTVPQHIMPVVAVNKDGVVGVSWYDRREHLATEGWWVRFRASYDGGDTWTPSVRVSESPNAFVSANQYPIQGRAMGGGTPASPRPLTVQFGPNAFSLEGGDTGGLVADAKGDFFATWIDNRTGRSQLWGTRITAPGTAVRNGAPELATLTDVSSMVMLQLLNTAYDPKRHELTFQVRLKNTSKDTIRAPIKARVLGLTSRIGTPELRMGDQRGVGAIVDLSSILPSGVLFPDALSGMKELKFQLMDPKPFASWAEINSSLIELKLRLFAQAPAPKTAEASK